MEATFPLPEAFVQRIWAARAYDTTALTTACGQSLEILEPGKAHEDQGPDFREAQVRIGGMDWHGHVEIHVHSQDWQHHKHDKDSQYDNTILHVVWESNGKTVYRQDGTPIPELALSPHVWPQVAALYAQNSTSTQGIACKELLSSRNLAAQQQLVEKLGLLRHHARLARFQARLSDAQQNWAQILWEELLAMMGGPVNRAVFRLLGERLTWRVLRKHLICPQEAEALLFGVTGMLSGIALPDAYTQTLQQHWTFLRAKYRLEPLMLPLRFARMRPAGFPTIRLAQTVNLLGIYPDLLSLVDTNRWPELLRQKIGTNPYWEAHTRLGVAHKSRAKNLGKAQITRLLVNVLLPMAHAYQVAHGITWPDEKVAKKLRDLPPEQNKYTRVLTPHGFPNNHALQSQGLIHLYTHMCQPKRCLSCAVGHTLLTSHTQPIIDRSARCTRGC